MVEAKTMKLTLLFIVMELFTVLAYPIVFVYSKLHQVSKSKASIPLAKLLVIGPVPPGS